MSDKFWARMSILFGYILLAVTFAFMLFVANLEIKDLDLWLHLGMGRYIAQNHFLVPPVDILSCAVGGKPWVNHEWLFQVIVYYIHSWQGIDGLIDMQIVVVSVTMLILLILGYSKEKQLATVFCLLLVSLVYHVRFTIRPDLYSLLFFVLDIFIMSFFLTKRWAVYVLFIIQVIWTNMHGFFFFGPLFALIAILAEWLKRNVPLPYQWNTVSRLTDEEYNRLGFVFIAVSLACLINPLTFKGAWYPISIFSQISGDSKIFFDKIIELQKPITWANIFDSADSPYYKLLIIISAISFFFNRRKMDIAAFIFWLVFLVFSLVAIRNVVFFAFAAYLTFMMNAANLRLEDFIPFQVTERRFVYITSAVFKIMLCVWVLQLWVDISGNGYFDFDTYERKSEFGGISQRTFPSKAADFLVANKIKGRFFNDFNAGAYLVGRCFPNIKVYIDGRTELYGPEFFKNYMDMWEKDNVELFKEALARYQITGILLNTVQQPCPPRILNYLYDDENWIPVYFDYDGLIFLKNVPAYQTVIAKYAIDFRTRQATQMDIYRLGSKKVTPYQNINRAYTLEAMGFDHRALDELNAALKVTPAYREPYKLKGKIYGKHKNYQLAFENFRIAVLLDPGERETRLDLAMAYYDLGQYKYAVDQYKRIIESWPEKAEAYFRLAQTLIKAKKYKAARGWIEQAHQKDPRDARDILQLGDMLYDDGLFAEAEEIYRLVQDPGPAAGEMHFKLGRVYGKLGDKEQSRKSFDRALQLLPGNKVISNELGRWQAQWK